MRTPSRSLTAAAAAAVVVGTAILAAASGTAASTPTGATTKSNSASTACRGIEQLAVPGAELLESACLSDLTTSGTVVTRHTDASSFLGFGGLSVADAAKPAAVPGIQLDGYFPDTSTLNTLHGWNHDSQFV